MAKTCSKGKESEERVAAVSSHPINAVNADHNAGLAYTNMANVSRRLWTESGPREGSGRGEGRGGGSGMQDTVKLPAESPIPVWVDGWNGLCPLRALGPPSNRVFVLSPCLWDSTLLFGTAPESSRYRAAASFRRVSYFKRPCPGARFHRDLSAVLPPLHDCL